MCRGMHIMFYDNIIEAKFISRPNRFIAEVDIDGHKETVHVKNTGRCRELLIPGCEVWLTAPDSPGRKTKYDLVAVRKDTGVLFNIDSQAPNKVAREWLETQHYDKIQGEYVYGGSRIDFYMEKDGQKHLLEVKGCTLEMDGIGYFPDAPTERGTKHLRELANTVSFRPVLMFVIQMDGITEVRGNQETDPAFCKALEDAQKAGVSVIFLPCHVEPDSLSFIDNASCFIACTYTRCTSCV